VRWVLVVAVVAVVALHCARSPTKQTLRFATFNIEMFPKDARQIDGAFAEIAALDAGFVGVQEIGEPELFAREAQRRLGARWHFVSIDTRPIGETRRGHHIGVLFDSRRWTMLSSRAHDETRLDRRHKPTLEVRLQSGDVIVRVLVVHLKSNPEGREVRHRQLAALVQVIRKSREKTIVLGDFNATDQGDRDDIARVASATGLVWATESLACSAFWMREDGCPRSRLDHVLTWSSPVNVHAAGACATEGCDWQQSCPIYARHVSDHCPVVVSF